MKENYDTQNQSQFFNFGGLVNLRLHTGYQVPAIHVQLQLAGPFRFIERIGLLIHKLELPDTMRVHGIVPVAHLDSATDPVRDPRRFHHPPQLAVIISGENEHQIERLVRKRRMRRDDWSTKHLIRWKGYGTQHDT